ncbi:conjugal transfer protein TraF [Massilia sp. H6]|uniref:conjugal transfer protein TraF n=1 Tax=Massilia sp. H6 TaxID=2970464 RepID=UPI002169E7AB|nr:conjugal transfer protein TraF [Massilia sp. H6]UVW30531.1 conjugal transfer protein TraF [Massilia sp. H6]
MRYLIIPLALGLSTAVLGQEVRTDDSYGDAFLHYKPYVVKGKTAKPPDTQVRAPAPQPKKEDRKVDVKWLQENYKLLEERAIDDPTDENVAAYLYVRRIAMDKSQRFSEKVSEVTNTDPLLNENNRIPYASAGAQSIRSANRRAQEQATRELATAGGLVVFVDGSCRFCAMQMPIVSALRTQYGMEALVVSLDGKRPRGYSGPLVRDNGLYRKLDLKLTPSVVYVHRPRAYQDGKDNNQYRVIAQGFYAQDELVKQIAFAGHTTKLLSSQTMRDLAVWNRGVASTEDLGGLELNGNDPAAIKRKLQPLLQKQYQ